ncbi:IS21-like element helper ATPase IstB [Mammaliicoccus sciuri]|uniref:IS21-like element helper ATPase IstB n=1 Tax=Mammaliicoccus sciuri TaxID=1296 RepID=UPI001E41FD74|nr:IS21-like element helper ATPase IstB [Mammaliicoccus sciuri]MCD8895738.1 IS21-like element helper ATPase IstB [Mammaliicoccus sciuri]MCD8913930.1 IS21-like element helper ATPase IstB [Mammaliicoccus sciuri]MEB5650924.1 IS21-like element helper ATPase IstB [Mammaliicoccus sciuri]MEB7408587.1 IS21-like element helper ATPase IstB [Mammaliicoccus sciuri]
MTNSTNYRRLKENLEYLKMNQMINHLDEVIDFSIKNELSFTDTLVKLSDYEIAVKEKNMIESMVKVAAFPFKKELSDFDFSFQPSINKQELLDFTDLRFIENYQNIVFLGSSGVGKTHLATAIGMAAAKKRVSTYFIKCHDLIQNLKRAQIENRLESRIKHYGKYKLLIIDEIGYLPIDTEDAKLFFQLIDLRYEKKSTIFTTNINFNLWNEVFEDPKIANAILDRILHHSNVVKITGKSYRLRSHLPRENDKT